MGLMKTIDGLECHRSDPTRVRLMHMQHRNRTDSYFAVKASVQHTSAIFSTD